ASSTTITWCAGGAAPRWRSAGSGWRRGPRRWPPGTASPPSSTPWTSSACARSAPANRRTVPDFLTGLPFWLTFGFLLFGAMIRGQGTYWIGRVAVVQTLRRTHPTGGWRLRAHRALSGEG